MRQEVIDEVLSDLPAYTIRDKNGNILNDNVDISLKTPVLVEGTPINGAFFKNLQGDLYSQDRYNKPVSIKKELRIDKDNYISFAVGWGSSNTVNCAVGKDRVVVTNYSQAVKVSEDGYNFIAGDTNNYTELNYSNGLFFGCYGANGTVGCSYSEDGLTWKTTNGYRNKSYYEESAYYNNIICTRRSSIIERTDISASSQVWSTVSDNSWNSITAGDKGFVFASSTAGIFKTEDGITLTQIESFPTNTSYYVHFENGVYFIINRNGGKIYWSKDLIEFGYLDCTGFTTSIYPSICYCPKIKSYVLLLVTTSSPYIGYTYVINENIDSFYPIVLKGNNSFNYRSQIFAFGDYIRVCLSNNSTGSSISFYDYCVEEFVSQFDFDFPLTSYENGKSMKVKLDPLTQKTQSDYTKPIREKEFDKNIIEPMSTTSSVTIIGTQNVTSTNCANNYYAFDGNDESYASFTPAGESALYRLGFQYSVAGSVHPLIKPKKIKITCSSNNPDITLGLVGIRADGSLKNLSPVPEFSDKTTLELDLDTGFFFAGFLLTNTANMQDGADIRIYNFEIVEGTLVSVFKNGKTLNGFEDIKININNLGAVNVEGMLYANDNIELVYEENIFKSFSSTQIISGYATDDNDDDIVSVNLGFKPKLVICYNTYNHSLSWNTSTGSASSTAGIISPKIISESLQTKGSGSEAYLTDTGFALNTKGYGCCYVAFK